MGGILLQPRQARGKQRKKKGGNLPCRAVYTVSFVNCSLPVPSCLSPLPWRFQTCGFPAYTAVFISSFETLNVCFFSDTIKQDLSPLLDYNLARGLLFRTRFDDLDRVSKLQACPKKKTKKTQQIACFRLCHRCSLNVARLLHTSKGSCTIRFLRHWCVFEAGNSHAFGQSSVGLVENFNTLIFLDTINVINIKSLHDGILIELYRFMPLSVTFTIFQDHSNVEQTQLKILCFYPIELKCHRTVKSMN